MIDSAEFSRQVRDALNHLFDYPHLQGHDLALLLWPDAHQPGPSRAHKLNTLLLETIEELNPPTAQTDDSFRSRCYHLLVYRYIDELPPADIMQRFSLSRRQFYREQHKAIDMVAALLQEKLPATSSITDERASKDESVLNIEAERFLSRRRAIDLAEIIAGVLAIVGPLAAQHGTELVCDLGDEIPPVFGSRTLLRQLYLKVLSTLITRPKTAQIKLQLHDRGQHIFTHVATETTSIVDGQIVNDQEKQDTPPTWLPDVTSIRHLVEMVHGKQMEFEYSVADATLSFEFPTHRDSVVLVVDDNEGVANIFRRYVAEYRYRVVGATSGEEALRLVRDVDPVAITLDIMMPNQDGWEVLQRLQSEPETQHIPVILCSALVDSDLAHSLGAAAQLQKPVTQAALIDVLEHLSA